MCNRRLCGENENEEWYWRRNKYQSLGKCSQRYGTIRASFTMLWKSTQTRQTQRYLFTFDKVLELEAKNLSIDSIIVGLTHNYMGIAYQYGTKHHDYTAALVHY